MQLKQNRYEVALLTSGNTTQFDPSEQLYHDPRTTSVEHGVAFVQSMAMKGLSLLVDDVMHTAAHIGFIRARGLSLYLWGDRLDNYPLLARLRRLFGLCMPWPPAAVSRFDIIKTYQPLD